MSFSFIVLITFVSSIVEINYYSSFNYSKMANNVLFIVYFFYVS